MITVQTSLGNRTWIHVNGVTVRYVSQQAINLTVQSLLAFLKDTEGLTYEVRRYGDTALPLRNEPCNQDETFIPQTTGLNMPAKYCTVMEAITAASK